MTPKQQAFLDAVLGQPGLDHNYSKAAREAGYSTPQKQGSRLAQHPGIAEAIRADASKRWEAHQAAWAERRKEHQRIQSEKHAAFMAKPGRRGRYRRRRKG